MMNLDFLVAATAMGVIAAAVARRVRERRIDRLELFYEERARRSAESSQSPAR
jgi:hypothetical protein